MKRVILALIALSLMLLAVVAAPNAGAATLPDRHYAECHEEDGSGPGQVIPCIWDGKFDGNGQGASYIVTVASPWVESIGLSDIACAKNPPTATCRHYPVDRHEWVGSSGRLLIMDPYPRGGIGTG